MFDRKNLLRVIKTHENNFYLCLNGKNKYEGRSAYICKNKNCFLMSKKRKGFEHSLKLKKRDVVEKIYTDVENLIETLLK